MTLMDCKVPNMDAYDATHRIREIEDGAGKRMLTRCAAGTNDEVWETKEKCTLWTSTSALPN